MLLKYKHFFENKISFDQELKKEIELYLTKFDDIDVEYKINEYLYLTNEMNVYKKGYRIILLNTRNINIDDYLIDNKTNEILAYFSKNFYITENNKLVIKIYELVTLNYEEVLQLVIKNDNELIEFKKFSENIFDNLKYNEKEKQFQIDNKYVFENDPDENVCWMSHSKWVNPILAIVNKITFDEINVITKAFFAEKYKLNIEEPYI
jgi:hypothetical protein